MQEDKKIEYGIIRGLGRGLIFDLLILGARRILEPFGPGYGVQHRD
jgi:hypothetical protein